jgi:hypothetical protein
MAAAAGDQNTAKAIGQIDSAKEKAMSVQAVPADLADDCPFLRPHPSR